MPRTIRFHLDENCPTAIAEGLSRRGVDVTTTPARGLMGASDEDQCAFALSESRVIFTQDKDFLRIHASCTPHAGIAYCQQRKRCIGEIITSLIQLWEVMEPDEMKNWLVYL